MARAAALVLLVLGLLPLANWIPGGHEAPWYNAMVREWIEGGVMLLLVGVLTMVILNRYAPPSTSAGQPPQWKRLAEWFDRGGLKSDVALAAGVLIIGIVVARLVYSGRPLLIDEIIQVFQARIFGSGQLWVPAPEYPEFTSSSHLLDMDGRRFGQFPPGWSMFMAPLTLIGAEWLAGPIITSMAVLAFARLMRRIEGEAATRALASLLLAGSPFVIFLGASHMNHMATTVCLLISAVALANVVASNAASWRWGALVGLGFGFAATIRPLDAAAFAIPTAVWLVWRALRVAGAWRVLVASGAGVAIPLALLMLYNSATTGDPLLFGYTALWGESHALGFHAAPWGAPHSPARGLELVNLYLLRLQFHLFETPVPGLLAATAALLLVPRISAFDRWFLVCSASLLAAYFAYWHDGYFLGPRFLLPIAPLAMLWTARLPGLLAQAGVGSRTRKAIGAAAVASVVWAAASAIPFRATLYANGLQTMRWDPAEALAAMRIDSGPILVRESWGAELVARLRGMGVSAADAEATYRRMDSCDLEHDIARIESAPPGARAAMLERLREPHRTNNEADLVAMPTAPDTSLRWRPGRQFDPLCAQRLAETRAGFTLYAPLLLSREGPRFVRDLHGRGKLVYPPGKEPTWLLVGDPVGGGGPRLVPVNPDSLRRDWTTSDVVGP